MKNKIRRLLDEYNDAESEAKAIEYTKKLLILFNQELDKAYKKGIINVIKGKSKRTKLDIKHSKKLAKMIDERHPDMKLLDGRDIKDILEEQIERIYKNNIGLDLKGRVVKIQSCFRCGCEKWRDDPGCSAWGKSWRSHYYGRKV